MFITWKYNTMNKSRKIHKGRPAMFLSLPLLNTCSNGGMFAYWMQKSDKPHSFNMNN